jgi:hypothetical protein
MTVKVLITIMSAGGRKDYRDTLRQRCLRRLPPGVSYIFFVGRDANTANEPDDVMRVDAGDGYLDLSEKVLKMFAQVLTQFDFEYLLKCDDNALTFPSQLDQVLRDRPDYAGNIVNPPWFSRSWHFGKLRQGETFALYDVPYIAPYAQGGCGYIIKRPHVEAIVRTSAEIDTAKEFYEDKMVGDTLHRAGVVPRHRKSLFVPRGNWHPGTIPLTLKCSSLLEMQRYSLIVTAPYRLRQFYYLVRRMYRRIRRTLMNRGYLENPFARGEGGFVVCHGKKFLAVNIPKNGSRSILRTVYEQDVGGKLPPDIYRYFGFRIAGRHRISVQAGKAPTYNGYVRFAVYRNPVERLVSLYRDKAAVFRAGRPQSYYLEQGVVGCSFDDFLTYVEHELQKPTAEVDEHVRRQIDFYHYTDVDWIVPLARLSEFFQHALKVPSQAVTDPEKGVSLPDLSPEQINRIRRLYAEDFLIANEANVYAGGAPAAPAPRAL